ncbi:MAG TPA: Stp1/IreP family PP2C-type Ser/Thr phosphatase [Haliangium sp.]|nr:Stp1/IreP family PP2C-type Ser/Thr phosphatase [Haliangium sp.]
MKYLFNGATHRGRVRERNEDYLLMDDALGLFLVCDGMGGHSAGNVASELVATTIAAILRENAEVLTAYVADPGNRARRKVKSLLERAVQDACQAVWQAAAKDKSKQGMGTTVALMLVCGRNAFVAHVGDSRVYLVRNHTLCQLTEDHTLLNDMLKHGTTSPDKAKAHPYSNALTRAVGIQPAVQPDILHVEIMLGDRFLICSDGLTAYVQGDDLLSLLKRPGIKGLADALISEANERGGRDNVTALILAMEEESRGPTTIEHSAMVAQKIEVLRRIPMFADFDFKQMAKLVEVGEVRVVRKGEVLIREGEADASLYVILYGASQVLRGGEIVNHLGEGNYFGEMSMLDKVPRSATVVASEAMTILFLDRERFLGVLQTDAGMATKVMWSIAQKLNRRLREADDEIHRLRRELGMPTQRDADEREDDRAGAAQDSRAGAARGD